MSRIGYGGSRDQTLVKLKFYQDDIPISDPGITDAHMWFSQVSGNNIYDPGEGLSSRPANGKAFYFTQYNRVQVYASKIKVTFTSDQPIGAYSHIGLVPMRWPSEIDFVSQWNVIAGQPHARYSLLGNQNSGRGIRSLTNFMTAKKMFAQEMNAQAFSHTEYATPLNQWQWCIFLQPTLNEWPSTADALIAMMHVQVTYYCRFYERKALGDNTVNPSV